MTDSGVILNELTHEYTRGDRHIPGVSHLLREAGAINADWFSDEAAQRGQAVHLAAQYIMQDDLDRDSVDPRITGYIAAIDKFMNQTGYSPIESEFIVEHKRFGYCGRCDGRGRMVVNGVLREVYLDWKTGAKLAWHRLQTAAYVGAHTQSDGIILHPRVCVYLKNTAKYALEIHENKNDFKEFLHLTNLNGNSD